MAWIYAEIAFASASAIAWVLAAFSAAPHQPSFYGAVPDWFQRKQRRASFLNSAGAIFAALAMASRVAGLTLELG